VVHDLVPVLASYDLKHGEHSDDKGVKVGSRRALFEVPRASEELHAEQGENENEQKEKK